MTMARPKKEVVPMSPSDVVEQISERKLKQLIKDARTAYKDTRAIAEDFGQKIAQAIEHDHLHRKAFAVIKTADRMEPEKLAEFFDALDYYRDASGLNERAASAPRMEMGNDNVEQFPDAAE
jgi:hypothetical protein